MPVKLSSKQTLSLVLPTTLECWGLHDKSYWHDDIRFCIRLRDASPKSHVGMSSRPWNRIFTSVRQLTEVT